MGGTNRALKRGNEMKEFFFWHFVDLSEYCLSVHMWRPREPSLFSRFISLMSGTTRVQFSSPGNPKSVSTWADEVIWMIWDRCQLGQTPLWALPCPTFTLSWNDVIKDWRQQGRSATWTSQTNQIWRATELFKNSLIPAELQLWSVNSSWLRIL